jgi:hypothetical protein
MLSTSLSVSFGRVQQKHNLLGAPSPGPLSSEHQQPLSTLTPRPRKGSFLPGFIRRAADSLNLGGSSLQTKTQKGQAASKYVQGSPLNTTGQAFYLRPPKPVKLSGSNLFANRRRAAAVDSGLTDEQLKAAYDATYVPSREFYDPPTQNHRDGFYSVLWEADQNPRYHRPIPTGYEFLFPTVNTPFYGRRISNAARYSEDVQNAVIGRYQLTQSPEYRAAENLKVSASTKRKQAEQLIKEQARLQAILVQQKKQRNATLPGSPERKALLPALRSTKRQIIALTRQLQQPEIANANDRFLQATQAFNALTAPADQAVDRAYAGFLSIYPGSSFFNNDEVVEIRPDKLPLYKFLDPKIPIKITNGIS